VARKIAVQSLQGAVDPFARAVLAHSQLSAHLRQGFVLKKAQQHRAPVFFAQRAQGLVQQRRDLLPQGLRAVRFDFSCHLDLLFLAPASGRRAPLGQGREAGGVEQPAGEGGLLGQAASFPGQDNEHRLRDFLGQMRIAHLAQGRRIHKADPPIHQRFKRRF